MKFNKDYYNRIREACADSDAPVKKLKVSSAKGEVRKQFEDAINVSDKSGQHDKLRHALEEMGDF